MTGQRYCNSMEHHELMDNIDSRQKYIRRPAKAELNVEFQLQLKEHLMVHIFQIDPKTIFTIL